jgi:peptide-methionine (S)-S-oxide reductase
MILFRTIKVVCTICAAFIGLVACAQAGGDTDVPAPSTKGKSMTTSDTATAILGGGCFWCVEAVFQRLDGVLSVESGYAGGTVANPTYKAVCEGTTGHAEVCRVRFDPSVVSFAEILHVFFTAHDPTTLNRQGNDVGTQYRSVIMYTTDEQRDVANDYIRQLNAAGTWADPIVTQVVPEDTFYVAEQYHQNYFNDNGSQPYCAFVVRPKVEKFLQKFQDRVKQSYK